MGEWQPIETAPRDGSRFLAWCSLTADEFDEDDNIIRRGVKEEYAVVAYYLTFGGLSGEFVEMPYRGSIPTNLRYLYWQPLPDPPKP